MKPGNHEHEGQLRSGSANSGIIGGLSKLLSERREHREIMKEFHDNVSSVENPGHYPSLWRRLLLRFYNVTLGPEAAEQLANSNGRITIGGFFRHWRQSHNKRLEVIRENRREMLNARREQREALRQNRPTLRDRVFLLLDYDATQNELGEERPATIFLAVVHFLARVVGTRILELAGVIFICLIGFFCYWAITQN